MLKYINNYQQPTIASIIKTLLFEEYEFKTKTIFTKDLKDGDLFEFDNNYYIKIKTIITYLQDIPLIEVFDLQSHQIKYAQIKDSVQRIEKCERRKIQ